MTAEATAADEWPLRRLLTDVMGSGPKSAADMSYGQARSAMDRILDGRDDPTTVGAFLLAARWKTNTPEELAGFLDALRERTTVAAPSIDPVDCGANYDGKLETALLGVAAGAVAAAAGVPVVVHSGDRIPAKRADTYRHVLESLGISTDLSPAQSARMVEETGVGYYAQERFAPALHALLDRREAMGVRTPINTVETLLDPADAAVHLGSFYHLSFGRLLAQTLAASRSIDVERVVLLQGLEGYDDVRPGNSVVAEWNGGAVEDWRITTADHGMDLARGDLAVDDVAGDSAAITESVLAGERTDRFADAVAVNAAIRLYAGERVETVGEGVSVARDVLAEGGGREVLEAIRGFDP